MAPLEPDIAVIQECARPTLDFDQQQCVWFGANPTQGVGIVTRGAFTVIPGPFDSRLDHSVFPAIVSGPTSFHLLAVWAQPRPSYVRALLHALDTYAEFLRSAPSVIVGDFNCFAQWRGEAPSKWHDELARRLNAELHLVSAYHASPGFSPDAPEFPTHYWRWRECNPFHIDYCFVPATWRNAIRSVHIGAFSEQHWRSDHRPVVVDLDLPASALVAAG
jgi:hypothetical protein